MQQALELRFFISASMAKDAALFVCRADDPRLPAELRGRIEVPCIVAGDLGRLNETLTLLRIAELWEESAPYRRRGRTRRPALTHGANMSPTRSRTMR